MTGETARTGMLVRNWRWLVIATVAVVAVAAVALTAWALSPRTDSAEPAASASATPRSSVTPIPSVSTSPTASGASTPPTNRETLVDIDSLGLRGLPVDEAVRIITDNRLSSRTIDAGYALREAQVGIVADVSPQGSLGTGSIVTLSVYGPMAAMRTPPEPWVVYGDSLAYDVPAGATLRVSTLRGESCATTTGTPTAHTFTTDRGRFANGERQITTTEPTADVSVPLVVDADAAGQKLEVRVATTCSNSVGDRVSDFSGPKTVQIISR